MKFPPELSLFMNYHTTEKKISSNWTAMSEKLPSTENIKKFEDLTHRGPLRN